MRLPTIKGLIRRRILVNYRVDPDVLSRQLPDVFIPKQHAGKAIAGICLIRLEQIAPLFVPSALGISSENGAHRMAVMWKDQPREGVYIPRRDTSSWLNHLAGGTLFPGEHHKASFDVRDQDGAIDFHMQSNDHSVEVRLRAQQSDHFPENSCFKTLDEASRFFEPGSLGYSVTRDPHRLDGIILKTKRWQVESLDVKDVYSSYFEDQNRFPPGSVEFDCALLMRNIEHEWHSADDLTC